MNIEEIFSRIEKSAIEQVDLRFVDPLGFWQHFTIPVKQFSKSVFGEGIGIDGSSFREWNSIYESDLTITNRLFGSFLQSPHTCFNL